MGADLVAVARGLVVGVVLEVGGQVADLGQPLEGVEQRARPSPRARRRRRRRARPCRASVVARKRARVAVVADVRLAADDLGCAGPRASRGTRRVPSVDAVVPDHDLARGLRGPQQHVLDALAEQIDTVVGEDHDRDAGPRRHDAGAPRRSAAPSRWRSRRTLDHRARPGSAARGGPRRRRSPTASPARPARGGRGRAPASRGRSGGSPCTRRRARAPRPGAARSARGRPRGGGGGTAGRRRSACAGRAAARGSRRGRPSPCTARAPRRRRGSPQR